MARKTTTKKRKKTTKTNSKLLTYITWFLAIIALMLSALVAGYYFGYKEAREQDAKKIYAEQKKNEALQEKLERSKDSHKDVTKRLQEVLKKGTKSYTSASHETDDEELVNPVKKEKKVQTVSTAKPKLAIIIDDVSTKYHVDTIKSLDLPLIMSFLPPSSARPNSAKLASHEKSYMVHLPMEAQHFSKEEPYTLRIRDSQQEILQRVKEVKQLFPRVKYINNHTGSKFTSDEIAMNRLFFALRKNEIKFVDSRTTAQTQAPKVSKNYGLNYVARDVFLDHHMEKEYVKEQIKKAVAFAQSHGKAIAIGHPHKNTLQAIAESRSLLSKVQLVGIEDIY